MIKTIFFDADDTLWHNEKYFRESESEFYKLLANEFPAKELERLLFETEVANLPLYGYGVKGFVMSMLETYTKLTTKSGDRVLADVKRILQIGRDQLEKPVVLLDGVREVIQELSTEYQLILATKGDLIDQERKLRLSGLECYFSHVQIMSDKQECDYETIFKKLNLQPQEILMVGNSLKSDILPMLNLGAWGVYIPYYTTWEHEKIDYTFDSDKFRQLESISTIPQLLVDLSF